MKILKSLLIISIVILTSLGALAQSKGMTLISGNPDFKVKVTRCEASGKTVVLDMVLENIGSRDVEVRFDAYGYILAYDDEGNKYGDRDRKVKLFLAGRETNGIQLPTDVPLKARVQIEGVPMSAQVLKRVDIYWYCPDWGGNAMGGSNGKMIKMTNVPISRDGD